MKKKVLLIGGAGYVGSVITDYLLEKGYQVSCLDKFLYKNQQTILPFQAKTGYKFIYGDFYSKEDVLQSLAGVSDVVILGGLVGDPITKKYPKESEKINNDAVQNLFQTLNSKGLNKVIFISTCSNYGLIKGDELADEDFELSPLSLYAKAKVAAEQKLLADSFDPDYCPVVLRFATAFGLSPRMRFDLTVNEFTRELFLGNELLAYDAKTWRPYCHVRDFARLVDIVISENNNTVRKQVFNAGGEMNNFTKQGIIDLIQNIIPNTKVKYQEQGSDPRNYRVNFSKVKDMLGFVPAFTVEDGIKELVSALDARLFDNVVENQNFHGNYEIFY